MACYGHGYISYHAVSQTEGQFRPVHFHVDSQSRTQTKASVSVLREVYAFSFHNATLHLLDDFTV